MEDRNIIGFFASIGMGDTQEAADEFYSKQGAIFRNYIWGDMGLSEKLYKLNNKEYGNDISLILFKFYVNPMSYLEDSLKEIENYRKSERSIGIPISINRGNFFSKTEEERYDFLYGMIFKKLDLLNEVVKKKKLNINIDLLKTDIKAVLDS